MKYHIVLCMRLFLAALTVLLMAVGCGGGRDGFEAIDSKAAVFWDRQTTDRAALMREIIDDFNAQGRTLPIKVEHAGGYTEIFRKVTASIRARKLPALAVAYESMTIEYIPTGAVAQLDDFIHDPEAGISAEDLEDFFPAVLETNTFPDYEGRMYSFPLAKSVLMLYFNKAVLAEAGLEGPPRTWDEFLDQSRQIKARTGKFAHAVSVDCSTINGMILSMGGEVYRDGEILYDRPESILVFELFETMAREKLLYQVTPGSYDDQVALSRGEVAFTLRTSSGRSNVGMAMEGKMEQWGMAMIPQADPTRPVTVLFGPNISIFNTTPDQKHAAWEFVKFFTSKETTVRWALGTGYLPVRRSAEEDPVMQAFWDEWEYNRAAFDCLPHARPEPNVAGWQQVRDRVEIAETAVLTGRKSGRQAALDLKREADAVLERHHNAAHPH